MKTYLKPKSINIEIDITDLMAGSETDMGGEGEFGAKGFSFRIIDDEDDWGCEEDHSTASASIW